MSKAGNFEIDVRQPNACRLTYTVDGFSAEEIRGFDFRELHDLIHAAKRALAGAHRQLTAEEFAREPKL